MASCTLRQLATKARQLLWGSEATAASGGRKEPSEWPRSANEEGAYVTDEDAEYRNRDAAYFESCHPDHASSHNGFRYDYSFLMLL